MDDKLLIEKMIKVVKTLSDEKKGDLALFALDWREASNQWNVIVSGGWINRDAVRENIGDILKLIRAEFNGQSSVLFAGVYPLLPDGPFVREIRRIYGAVSEPQVLTKVSVGNLVLEKLVLFVATPIEGPQEQKPAQ